MILAEVGADPQLFQYLGVLFLALVVTAFAVGTMFASKLADTPYECGMLPGGDGTSRLSVKFYLVAMLFILFDIEVVFLYPWAVVYKDMLKDPASANLIFGTMVSFLGILFIGYIYAIKRNAFDWNS